MSYAVQVGAGGYQGWKLLQRTGEMQRETLEKTTQVQSARDYYTARFDNIQSADDLVSDYRMLKITLTAFGLQDDIQNRAFIKKVLESDLGDSKSLANRLGDKRYLKMATALGLGDGNPTAEGTVSNILNRYVDQTFRNSVGDSDSNLHLALNAKAELGDLARSTSSEDGFWYSVLASKPLKTVFEGAFGLPSSFTNVSIDRQLEELKDRAEAMFGSSSPDIFTDEDTIEKLARTFLVRSQISEGSVMTPYSAALTLLRGGN